MDISHVLVNLDSKPKCEVICPHPKCNHVSKLAPVAQVVFPAPPKFNTHNFERHFKTQHVNKKRRALQNITNAREMSDDVSGFYSPNLSIELFSSENVLMERRQNMKFTSTPKRVCVRSITSHTQSSVSGSDDTELVQMKNRNDELEIQLENYREEIRELNSKYTQKVSDFESLQKQQPSADVIQLTNKIGALQNENAMLYQQQIVLRHKMMDMRGTVRGFLRLKPVANQPQIEWSVGVDKTNLKFGKKSKMIYVGKLDSDNRILMY